MCFIPTVQWSESSRNDLPLQDRVTYDSFFRVVEKRHTTGTVGGLSDADYTQYFIAE